MKENSFIKGRFVFPFFILLVIILWGLNLYFVPKYFDEGIVKTETITKFIYNKDKSKNYKEVIIKEEREKDQGRGTFGDMFGVVNSLFTGFGFAGLLYTIWLQRTDLRNQDEKFIKESVDNKFFWLLELHEKVFEKVLVHDSSGKKHYGIDAFNEIIKKFRKYSKNKDIFEISLLNQFLEKEYILTNSSILNYFKSIERIVEFLESIHIKEINLTEIPFKLLKCSITDNEFIVISIYYSTKDKKDFITKLFKNNVLNLDNINYIDLGKTKESLKNINNVK